MAVLGRGKSLGGLSARACCQLLSSRYFFQPEIGGGDSIVSVLVMNSFFWVDTCNLSG